MNRDRQPHHLIVTKVDDDSFGANDPMPDSAKNVFKYNMDTLRSGENSHRKATL